MLLDFILEKELMTVNLLKMPDGAKGLPFKMVLMTNFKILGKF